MLASLHNAFGAGLLVAGPVVALMLFLSRRRALNFGLRMSRALMIGGYLAATWVYLVFLIGLPDGWRGRLIVMLVPVVFLVGPPVCVELRERLLERAWVRRWFFFEEGGSARWTGPHQIRPYRTRLFRRRPVAGKGYINA